MPNIDHSNRHVTDRLANTRWGGLHIETTPVADGVETTVRNGDRDRPWTPDYADQLKVALLTLPGHPYVRRSPVRDMMTFIWDGV